MAASAQDMNPHTSPSIERNCASITAQGFRSVDAVRIAGELLEPLRHLSFPCSLGFNIGGSAMLARSKSSCRSRRLDNRGQLLPHGTRDESQVRLLDHGEARARLRRDSERIDAMELQKLADTGVSEAIRGRCSWNAILTARLLMPSAEVVVMDFSAADVFRE